MKKYLVTMECATLSSIEVEAETEIDAKEKAENALRGMCTGDTMEFYEIKQL